jgi:putative restriction endonuclease
MSAWWVNHKQTHKQEIEGGYLWSPKKDKNGARNQAYLNMPLTKKGETIFSYAFGEIKAVGRINGECTDARRPSAFGETGEQWSRDGWLVPVEWTMLSNPLSPRTHWTKIEPLLPKKYSPIRAPGIGNQKLYLCEIDYALADLLLGLIRQNNPKVPG